jgi:hypothetical protein
VTSWTWVVVLVEEGGGGMGALCSAPLCPAASSYCPDDAAAVVQGPAKGMAMGAERP